MTMLLSLQMCRKPLRFCFVAGRKAEELVTMVAKEEREEGKRNVKWKNKADSNFED